MSKNRTIGLMQQCGVSLQRCTNQKFDLCGVFFAFYFILFNTFIYYSSFRYGEQKVSEGVDGAELLTLYEKGLLPLDGEEREIGGNGNDHMEEDDDDDGDKIPNLVALPTKLTTAAAPSGAAAESEMDDDGDDEEEEEENDEDMEGRGGPKKRVRSDCDDEEPEEEEEEGEQEEGEDEEEGGGRASKRARREATENGTEQGREGEDVGKKARRSKKAEVKFASEVKKVDGPGPNGALDGAGPDPRKV